MPRKGGCDVWPNSVHGALQTARPWWRFNYLSQRAIAASLTKPMKFASSLSYQVATRRNASWVVKGVQTSSGKREISGERSGEVDRNLLISGTGGSRRWPRTGHSVFPLTPAPILGCSACRRPSSRARMRGVIASRAWGREGAGNACATEAARPRPVLARDGGPCPGTRILLSPRPDPRSGFRCPRRFWRL